LLKVAGLACLSLIDKEDIIRILAPVQLGVGVKGGVEVAIHRLQAYIDQEGADPDIVLLFLDISDAFMTANRAKMLEALFKFKELSPIWRLAHWHLSVANPRYVRMDEGRLLVLHQTEGGPQGDPLMPLLFSLLIARLHDAVLTGSHCCPVGFLDDTAFGAKIDVAATLYDRYVYLAPEITGCKINPPKTVVLSCAASPSPAVLAFAKKTGITLHRNMTTYCGVVLGAKGTEDQQSEWVVDQVCTHSQMFELLAHPRMSSQFVHSFLRICAVPKLMLLIRALSTDITLAATKLMDLCICNTLVTATNTEDMFTAQGPDLERMLIQLEMSKIGLGIQNLQTVAPVASYASIASAAKHMAAFLLPPNALPPHSSSPSSTLPSSSSSSSSSSSAAALGGPPQPPTSPPPFDPCSLSAYHTRTPPAFPSSSASPFPSLALAKRFQQAQAFISVCEPDAQAKIRNCLPNNLPQFTQLYVSDASAKSDHLQRALYSAYKDSVLKRLFDKTTNPLYKSHLMSLNNPGAMVWTSLDLRRPEYHLSNTSFNNAVRMALAMQPSQAVSADPHAKCCCGFLLHRDPLHFYACPKFRKLAGNIRHDDVRIETQTSSERAGFVTTAEHQFPNGKRADFTLLCPLTNTLIHGDVSIATASAESHRVAASRKSLSAAEARVQAKETKYAELCRADGAYFVPFVVETTGAMSKPALQMISRIADQSAATNPHNPDTAERLTKRIAIALHNGNAKIIQQGLARSAQTIRPAPGR
jgi:hypothetical protein